MTLRRVLSKLLLIVAVSLAWGVVVPDAASAQDSPRKKAGAKKKTPPKKKAGKAARKKKSAKKAAKRNAGTRGRKAPSLDEAAKREAAGKSKAPGKSAPSASEEKKSAKKKSAKKKSANKKGAAKKVDEPEEPSFQRVVSVKGGLLTHFRKVLADFGRWTTDAQLGYVWVPDYDEVGSHFAPYVSGGHWEVTEKGSWTWASDYDWGHIPFHYGRWEWADEHGWVWIPGKQWAPAWVVWRLMPTGYDYSAWAPTPALHTYKYVPSRRRKGRDATFVKRARKGKKNLRFMFVFNQYLFGSEVSRYVIWDPDVAAWLGARSKTFRKHGRAMRPVSPTYEEAAVPDYWAPVDAIDLTDDRIRPFVTN